MLRRLAFPILLVTTACGAQSPPIASASSATAAAPVPLARGGSGEARLRCGSQSLRARLREGQLLVQVDQGETRILAPVSDPRAGAGPAYGDGKLTLYRLPEAESWRLARGGETAGSPCHTEGTAP